MAGMRSKWQDEGEVHAYLQQVAKEKAQKRQQREQRGIERKPQRSLWAWGVTQGRELLDDSPGEVKEVLEFARSMVAEEFEFNPSEAVNGRAALALFERKRSFYQGLEFALTGGKPRAAMFAAPAPPVRELVAAR